MRSQGGMLLQRLRLDPRPRDRTSRAGDATARRGGVRTGGGMIRRRCRRARTLGSSTGSTRGATGHGNRRGSIHYGATGPVGGDMGYTKEYVIWLLDKYGEDGESVDELLER